jgi:hypothetical protein
MDAMLNAAIREAAGRAGFPFDHRAEVCEFDRRLTWCSACETLEAGLPTQCPGEPLTGMQSAAVYEGRLDYRRGHWTDVAPSLYSAAGWPEFCWIIAERFRPSPGRTVSTPSRLPVAWNDPVVYDAELV